jgi:hypothetical protein
MRSACVVLYYHPCPLRLYNIFPHLKRHDFWGEKLLNINCVFWFALQRVSQTFLTLTKILRDTVINEQKARVQSTRYSHRPLIKPEFSRHFRKIWYQFSWKSVQWEQFHVVGREDMKLIQSLFATLGTRLKSVAGEGDATWLSLLTSVWLKQSDGWEHRDVRRRTARRRCEERR